MRKRECNLAPPTRGRLSKKKSHDEFSPDPVFPQCIFPPRVKDTVEKLTEVRPFSEHPLCRHVGLKLRVSGLFPERAMGKGKRFHFGAFWGIVPSFTWKGGAKSRVRTQKVCPRRNHRNTSSTKRKVVFFTSQRGRHVKTGLAWPSIGLGQRLPENSSKEHPSTTKAYRIFLDIS